MLAAALSLFAWNALRFCGSDFRVYRSAGESFLSGRDVYALRDPGFPYQRYRYQPGTAVLFAPLALLPYRAAKTAWILLSALVALAVAAWLERRLGARGRIAVPLAWLCLFHPLAQELQLGQVDLLVLGALVGAFALEDRGRPWSAGALIAIATGLKVAPAIFLVDAVLRRRWRAVGGVALGMTGLVAACALRYGIAGCWAEHVTWFQTQRALAAELLDHGLNQSAFAMARSVGGGVLGGVAASLAVCAVALSARDLERRRALCLVAVVLATPNGWVQAFVLAMPLAAILLAGPAGGATAAFLLALGTGLLGYDVLGSAGEAWALSHRLLGLDLLALFVVGRLARPSPIGAQRVAGATPRRAAASRAGAATEAPPGIS